MYSTEYGAKEDKKMPVLTAEDRKFWEENGYVVLHNAVSTRESQSCRAGCVGFLGDAVRQSKELVSRPVSYHHHDRDVSASGTLG